VTARLPVSAIRVLHGLIGIGLIVIPGCGITDAPPPDPDRFINLSVVGGAEQVGLPDSQLSEPLEVRLVSTVGAREPVTAREVQFTPASGSGITLNPARAITDVNGIARTQVRLGSAIGRHTIQINFSGNPGAPGSATVEAALAPVVAQISPSAVAADAAIVITGQNFGSKPEHNEVFIDGTRAQITAVTPTRIDARVSACVPTRSTTVTVQRGSLASAPVRLDITASAGQTISPAIGQMVAVSDRNGVGCVRIAPPSGSAEYLVITQHTANSGTTNVPLRMIGMRTGTGPVASPVARVVPASEPIPTDGAHLFRARMREREAEIMQRMRPRVQTSQQLMTTTVPAVGERRPFRVFVPLTPARTINAAVRAVGRYIAVYEDVEAEGSVPQAELERALALMEEPVYATTLAVFGAAPDLDRNERIILLLTPGVNRLTKADETSYISGYFDPCDLVDVNECSDTNRAEILYSVVPDPTGRWGLRHSVASIVGNLPSLAAHEFAHLIHFNQRALVSNNRTPEELWLSEAMAHFAEDTVATILRQRGMTAEADAFARPNLIRAHYFLTNPDKTSLVSSSGQATLEERGAGWLFLKYLMHRAGGGVLKRLETAAGTGAGSVVTATGISWATLMRDWSVALYASGSPDFAAVTLPSEHTFGAFNLRTAIGVISQSGYPLIPMTVGAGDFSVDWSLSPSSTTFTRLTVPAGTSANLILAGSRGGDFAAAAQPQLLVVRIR
jgi:hypothetical protein